MKNFPWIIRFIEIAKNSISVSNQEFKEWNLGFSGIKKDIDRVKYNTGKGIELAPETYVCSRIVQSCISSPLFSGAIIDKGQIDNSLSVTDPRNEIKKGIRFWKIESEKSYRYKSKCSCDIAIQRYDWDIEKWHISSTPYQSCFIEAKRAIRIPFNKTSKTAQQNSIIDDIKKFVSEFDWYKKNGLEGNAPFFYNLIWGTNHNLKIRNALISTPEKYLSELKESSFIKENKSSITLDIHQKTWIPAEWDMNKQGQPASVTKATWIMLVGVTIK